MKRTKTDAALEAAEQAHADDPERAELLHRARRFKSSWVELGEALTEARRSGSWQRWGHASFEEYARVELHLRRETVDKLTGSFQFLKSRAPEVLERDGVSAPIPSYQSVDFLRRAEEKHDAPGEAVEAIRRRVIDDGARVTAVTREFGGTVFPIDEPTQRARDAAALKNVATRLRDLLSETRAVPKKLAGDVAGSLERLLDALGSDEEAAA